MRDWSPHMAGAPRLLALACVALAPLLAPPARAQAQLVTGTVQESGSGAAVAGALVRLLDAEGDVVRSFLTAADGRYRLRGARNGPHTLVVERIGYASTRIGPVHLSGGGATLRNIVVTQNPIELEGLTVEGAGRRCDLRDEGTGATQVVWAQVRTALEASTWTGREGNLGFRIRAWERRLSPGDLTILDEGHRTYRTRAGNSVRSFPARELAQGGYVRSTDDGMVEFYAPDAEALLSETFLAEHCFSLRSGAGDSEGLLGLDFAPVLDRDTADVRGTMWVERRTGRLAWIDFAFTGLSYEVGSELAGGRIRYAPLPDGRWIVEEWRIRAPAVVVRRSSTPMGRRDRQMVEAVHETGAQVQSVQGEGFAWTPDRSTATVRGNVYDSIAGGPLSGAVIRVAGRGWRTESGPEGRFELAGLPEGRYRVVFEHPRLDSLGLAPRGRDVTLEAGAAREVALAIPAPGTLLAETCPAEMEGGVVVGWVTAPDGSTAVPGTSVRAVATDGREVAEARSGVDGSYRMCGVPAGEELGLTAWVGPMTSETVRVRPGNGHHVRADLTVSWSTAATAEDPRGLMVTGTVRDASNGRPLATASVELVDESGAVLERVLTDASGAFRLTAGDGEPARLRFSSIGYAPVESGTLPPRARRHRVEVELSPEAMEVEGVVVTVEGRRPALEEVGFYDRMRRTAGTLLDRDELGMESARRATDALLRLPGVEWFDSASRSGNTTRQFIQFRRAARAIPEGDPCLPAIYVDGSLARWGKGLGSDSYPTLDELVSGADIEAVELYDSPAWLPPRFMGPGTLCGAIVVWTRR